jgi:tetratricopeptide (TPR) repeat protein
MCICCLAHTSTPELDYYSPENILRFAGYLFDAGDFLRAAGEYQRYLFSFDTFPDRADSVFFKIAECYRLTGNYQRAIERYKKTIDTFEQSPLNDECVYKISLCFLFLGQHDESLLLLRNRIPATVNTQAELHMQLTAANFLFQRQWQAAIDIFAADSFNNKITSHIINYAHQGLQLPRKNRTLAGIYSAVIPGTGKFYCGRTIDGIQSLATVGVLGWEAYTGFRDDGVESVKGWVFGVIGGVFYLGNIYGSVVAAEIYNEEQEERLLQKIKVFVNVNFN